MRVPKAEVDSSCEADALARVVSKPSVKVRELLVRCASNLWQKYRVVSCGSVLGLTLEDRR